MKYIKPTIVALAATMLLGLLGCGKSQPAKEQLVAAVFSELSAGNSKDFSKHMDITVASAEYVSGEEAGDLSGKVIYRFTLKEDFYEVDKKGADKLKEELSAVRAKGNDLIAADFEGGKAPQVTIPKLLYVKTEKGTSMDMFAKIKAEKRGDTYKITFRGKPEPMSENQKDPGAPLATFGLEQGEYAILGTTESEKVLKDYRESLKNLEAAILEANKKAGERRQAEATKREAEALVAAIKLNPRNAVARNKLGGLLIAGKIYDEGIAQCMEAIRIKPDYGEALANVGIGLSGLKRFEEALPYYHQGLFYMRKSGATELDRVLLNYGLAWHEIGRHDDARAAFKEAIVINPKNAPCLNNLGNYEFLAGRYAQSKDYYQRATEADPEFAEAWYDLGNAVVALAGPDAWSEAEQHYRRALKLAPDLTLAQDNLARLLLAMKRPAEAAALFEKITKENPGAVVQFNAAKAFMQSGKTAEAIPLLEAVLKENANNIEAHYLLGNARYRMDDKEGAMTAYRQAIRINPFAVEPHGNLGSLLASLGKWEEAITELETALKLRPDYAEAHQNFANALVQLGRDTEAREHYEEATRLKPEMAQTHYNYARLLKRLGEIEAARERVQKALKLRPDYSDAVEFLETLPPAP